MMPPVFLGLRSILNILNKGILLISIGKELHSTEKET